MILIQRTLNNVLRLLAFSIFYFFVSIWIFDTFLPSSSLCITFLSLLLLLSLWVWGSWKCFAHNSQHLFNLLVIQSLFAILNQKLNIHRRLRPEVSQLNQLMF